MNDKTQTIVFLFFDNLFVFVSKTRVQNSRQFKKRNILRPADWLV